MKFAVFSIETTDSLVFNFLGLFIWILVLYALIYLPIKELVKIVSRKLKEKETHKIHFYDKPLNVTTAEMSRLLDKNADDGYEAAFIASIVDLHTKGRLLNENDLELTKYEKALVKGIVAIPAADKDYLVALSDNLSIPISYRVAFDMELEMAQYNKVDDSGGHNFTPINLKIFGIIGCIVIFLSLFGGVISAINMDSIFDDKLARVRIYFVVGVLLAIFIIFILPFMIFKRTRETTGSLDNDRLLGEIYGYKEYLETVEKDNIEFELAEDTGKIMNDHLVNAIALEAVKINDLDELLKRQNPEGYRQLMKKTKLPPHSQEVDGAAMIEL